MPPAPGGLRKDDGFEVTALLDVPAATTRTAARNSRDLLRSAGVALMSVAPMATNLLGDFNDPADAGLYEAMSKHGVFEAFARGDLR